jgi:hypothetical protein
MHKVLQFPQFPLVRISHLPWVTESDLSQEVTIRRATPAFAHQWGGPVTRAFLEHAKRAGFIHPNSIVMAQVSPFVMGAGSTPPYWHFDYTQGHGPTEDDDTFWPAAYDHTGLIMCAFDTAQHPDDQGTLFLEGHSTEDALAGIGSVVLNLFGRDSDREYIPKQNTTRSIESGRLYWYHWPVEGQLAACPDLTVRPLRPNSIYFYAASHVHCVPIMRSDWGRRVVVRVNTPVNPTFYPPIENLLFSVEPEPVYVFRMVGPDRWVRQRIVA